VGTVIAYAGPIDEDHEQKPARRQILAAQGWLVCDGSPVQISEFPALAALLGDAYGNQEDGKFYLPDYQGVFLRGVNGNREPPRDPGISSRIGSGLHEPGAVRIENVLSTFYLAVVSQFVYQGSQLLDEEIQLSETPIVEGGTAVVTGNMWMGYSISTNN
jgi:hypothetical protein